MKSIFVKLSVVTSLVLGASAFFSVQAKADDNLEAVIPEATAFNYCNKWSASSGYSDCHECIYIFGYGQSCD